MSRRNKVSCHPMNNYRHAKRFSAREQRLKKKLCWSTEVAVEKNVKNLYFVPGEVPMETPRETPGETPGEEKVVVDKQTSALVLQQIYERIARNIGSLITSVHCKLSNF